MKIAAVTKLKHGEIWKALNKLGWNQSDLARKLGTCPTNIADIVNLKRRPGEEFAKKIEIVFLNAGVCVDVMSQWPELFKLKKNKLDTYREIERNRLLEFSAQLSLEVKETLEIILRKLKSIEIEVLINHLVHGESLGEIAKRNKLTRGRVHSIKVELRRKLADLKWKIDLDGNELKAYLKNNKNWKNESSQKYESIENRYNAYCLIVEQMSETPVSFEKYKTEHE